MTPIIYVETTIPSFYTETRAHEQIRVRRQWTREWWHATGEERLLVTSWIVVTELGDIPVISRREEALSLLRGIRQLDYNVEVAELSKLYINRKLMPVESLGDADHLALATIHGCDMLVTWNCKHLANAHKMAQIRRINALMDLATPLIVTPLELLNIR